MAYIPVVTIAKGGTSLTAVATGGLVVAGANNVMSAVASTTNYTVLQNNSGTITWAAIMTSYSAAVTANVTITAATTTSAATWYTGATISSVIAGTYMAVAQITIGKNTAAVTTYYGRLFNTTMSASYSSGQQHSPAVAYNASTIPLNAIFTITATSSIVIQGACTTASALILARIYTSSAAGTAAGNTASHVELVRIQ